MGLYYNIIDPSIFITTIGLCVTTMIMIQQTHILHQHSGFIYTVLGLSIFYSIMFLLFNFRFIYNRQNKKHKQDAYSKSYDALYDYGTRYRDIELSFGMIILAFAGFMAALTMMSFGIYFVMLGNGHDIDNNDNEISIPSNIRKMLLVTGIMCILCSVIAMARMPLQYLFVAMGLRWILILFFNVETY